MGGKPFLPALALSCRACRRRSSHRPPHRIPQQEPELAARLAAFRERVSTLLYDQLGAHARKKPAFDSP